MPIEELLSSVASGAGARSTNATPSPRATAASASPRSHAPATASPSPVATPAVRSPFASSSSTPVMQRIETAVAISQAEASPKTTDAREPIAASSRQATPFPAATAQPNGFAETLTEGALANPPAQDPASIDQIRPAVVQALAAANHATASQLLSTGTWTLDGSSLRIEVPGMGKKMLAITVNAAAEKIIRQELQRLGAPSRFLVVPGDGAISAATAAPTPSAGSIQQAALEHPMVQKAREIFNAEVRSVLDLRTK
jgi:DNA polymerase-3 subunit gamma/tau